MYNNNLFLSLFHTYIDDVRDLCIRPASHRKSIKIVEDGEEPNTGDSFKKKKIMRRQSSIMSFDSSNSNGQKNQNNQTMPRLLTLPPPSQERRLYYGPAAHLAGSSSIPKWRYHDKPSHLLFKTHDVDIHDNHTYQSGFSQSPGGGGDSQSHTSSSYNSSSSSKYSQYSYVSSYSASAQSNSSCSKAVSSSIYSSPSSLRRRLIRPKLNSTSCAYRIALRESAIRELRTQSYQRRY